MYVSTKIEIDKALQRRFLDQKLFRQTFFGKNPMFVENDFCRNYPFDEVRCFARSILPRAALYLPISVFADLNFCRSFYD